jgi:hypothetical protein
LKNLGRSDGFRGCGLVFMSFLRVIGPLCGKTSRRTSRWDCFKWTLNGIDLVGIDLAGINFSKHRDESSLGTAAGLIRCSFFANGSFNAASMALMGEFVEIKL